MTTPDEKWLPFLKVGFGYMVLVLLATLASIIALGHVDQQNSYGLEGIIGALGVLAGGFAHWCFQGKEKQSE